MERNKYLNTEFFPPKEKSINIENVRVSKKKVKESYIFMCLLAYSHVFSRDFFHKLLKTHNIKTKVLANYL